MKVNEDSWKFMQKHLGYTDEELELFRNNPKNADDFSLSGYSIRVSSDSVHQCVVPVPNPLL